MADKGIGLAIIGCGTVGRYRAELARENVAVSWLGLCDIDESVLHSLASDTSADFATDDFRKLLDRPEVTAVIVATAEHDHVDATVLAAARGLSLFIEKPLATNVKDSRETLQAIEASGVDAVVGYTQRFRRRFQVAKARIVDGQIGDITSVVCRAFMNRMVPLSTLSRSDNRSALTPMVVSGTHSADVCMWLMDDKTPDTVFAQSIDTTLSEIGTKDATFGVVTMDDGSIWSMNINWALPVVWPGSVYGLEIGVVGTKGVIDLEDTHRDAVLASEVAQPVRHGLRAYEPAEARHVEFLGSFPPGDMSGGMLWGPLREETMTWFSRLTIPGLTTPHASAADGHRNLILTLAMDESARSGKRVSFADVANEVTRT